VGLNRFCVDGGLEMDDLCGSEKLWRWIIVSGTDDWTMYCEISSDSDKKVARERRSLDGASRS